jgi:hypothetical protein
VLEQELERGLLTEASLFFFSSIIRLPPWGVPAAVGIWSGYAQTDALAYSDRT